MLSMDGYDTCILGAVERCGQPPFLVYDIEKVVQKLMDDDGMTRDEAVDFFEFNQLGAWLGEGTPGFLTPYDESECYE